MSKIDTKHFGALEIAEDKIVTFPRGLIGFERATRYFLRNADKGDSFKWLQSLDDPNLCFLVIEPATFMFDYTLEVPDATARELKIDDPGEVLIYALVVVPEDPKKISANLCGPLVINAASRLGAQVVSTDPNHKVRHFILEEMKRNAATYFGLPAGAPEGKPPAADASKRGV